MNLGSKLKHLVRYFFIHSKQIRAYQIKSLKEYLILKQFFFVSFKITDIFIALSASFSFGFDLFIRQIECYSSNSYAFIFPLKAEENKTEENSILWQLILQMTFNSAPPKKILVDLNLINYYNYTLSLLNLYCVDLFNCG